MADRNAPSVNDRESEVTSAAKTTTYKRYRFNVPYADESTIAWAEAQVNLSTSLRQLIRAEIERSGYVDAMCTPVEQLPKKGRPFGSETKHDNSENASESDKNKTESQTTQVQAVLPVTTPVSPAPALQPVQRRENLADNYSQVSQTASAASTLLDSL